jgi:hypothetical protein
MQAPRPERTGRERRRCPFCGGRAIQNDSLPDGPGAVCINCGRSFSIEPSDGRRTIRIPAGTLLILVCLALGVGAGIAFALLSNIPTLGGWLLVALGISMVVVMGAFEAGYMEGVRLWLQSFFKPAARS